MRKHSGINVVSGGTIRALFTGSMEASDNGTIHSGRRRSHNFRAMGVVTQPELFTADTIIGAELHRPSVAWAQYQQHIREFTRAILACMEA